MNQLEMSPYPTIPCKRGCGRTTTMLGTKLCDSCWEEDRRKMNEEIEAMNKPPKITFSSKRTPIVISVNGVTWGRITRGNRFFLLHLTRVSWKGLPWKEVPVIGGYGVMQVGRRTLTECKSLAIRTIQNNYSRMLPLIEEATTPRRGLSPTETKANTLLETKAKYLVVHQTNTGLQNFGFFSAYCANEARVLARTKWQLGAYTYLQVWHPDNLPDTWSFK